MMRGAEGELDRLHHVAIPCDDVSAAVAWYTERFRCEVAYRDETWSLLRFQNASLALVTRGEHPGHFGVEGPKPDTLGEVRTHRDGVRFAYLRDPWGNVVEVVEEPEEPERLRP
jgi:catechol 2,3-dioxygenase-like lactoylglutathione lyase family enzyme